MSVDRSKVLSAAQKHLAKGNYDRAIAEYRRLVDEDPGDVRTWLKIGDLQTRKGAHKDASDTYHRVAEHYAEQGFFLKAVAVYKQILKLQPTRLDISLRLAEMYEQLQLVSDALQTYEQAAAAYARQGDADNMLAILDRMAKLDPENIPVRIKYAEALSKAKEVERAASEFEAGARLLEEQGRIDDYLKVAERLLYHRPGDVALSKKLARTYLSRNDAKRALSKLQACFKKDPRDIATLELLAQAFHVLGQSAKTISVYKEMVRILAEKKEDDERARILKKILELDPNDAEARQELAKFAAPSVAPRRPVDSVPPGALVGARSQRPPPEDDDEPELEIIEHVDEDDDDLMFVDEDASDVDLVESVRPPARDVTQNAEAPGPEGRSSVPPEVAREAQIARLLTECEVFERYGLQEKVAKQLFQVIEVAPEHIEARERLKEALIKLGRNAEAAEQLRALAELQPQVATMYLRQADELDEASGEPEILIDETPLVVDIDEPVEEFESMAPADEFESMAPAVFPDEEAPTGQIDATSVAPAPEGLQDMARDSIEELDPDELMEMELDDDMLMPLSEPPPSQPEYDEHEAVFTSPVQEPTAPESARPAVAPMEPEFHPPEEQSAFDRAISSVPEDPQLDPVVPDAPLAPMSPQEFEAAPVDLNEGHVQAAKERISMPPGEIEETLDEVEFFIAQGLWDAASATLEDALESHPNHPLLLDKLQEVQETRASLSAPVESYTAEEDDDAFALAEKLAGELGPMDEGSSEGSDVIDVESVFEQFKKGVEEQVGLEDTDTHFDLGIAYKEMGLVDDAVKEFQLAMANPQRECLCHTMIGLCRVEQGNYSDAINQFKKGLYAEHKTEREELGLYFELGSAYEMLQDPQEALYYYQKVQKRDPDFRGVEERIQRLTRPSQAPASEHEPLVLDEVDQAFDDLLGDD
ncbi:MAG: tetratricopeptide repeat protein [Deltaproteobacteria bacterium]|nr:tetratricopeptide repeat protein [Deltaproteobacteria bacterium]